MSPYKLNLFLLAIVFGIVPAFLYWFVFVAPLSWIESLSWIKFSAFNIIIFALIYWRIEKHIRDGRKRIGAVIYLIASSLITATVLPVWLIGLKGLAFFLTIVLILLVFIIGTSLGIILIFRTYRNLPQDKLS